MRFKFKFEILIVRYARTTKMSSLVLAIVLEFNIDILLWNHVPTLWIFLPWWNHSRLSKEKFPPPKRHSKEFGGGGNIGGSGGHYSEFYVNSFINWFSKVVEWQFFLLVCLLRKKIQKLFGSFTEQQNSWDFFFGFAKVSGFIHIFLKLTITVPVISLKVAIFPPKDLVHDSLTGWSAPSFFCSRLPIPLKWPHFVFLGPSKGSSRGGHWFTGHPPEVQRKEHGLCKTPTTAPPAQSVMFLRPPCASFLVPRFWVSFGLLGFW